MTDIYDRCEMKHGQVNISLCILKIQGKKPIILAAITQEQRWPCPAFWGLAGFSVSSTCRSRLSLLISSRSWTLPRQEHIQCLSKYVSEQDFLILIKSAHLYFIFRVCWSSFFTASLIRAFLRLSVWTWREKGSPVRSVTKKWVPRRFPASRDSYILPSGR